MAVATDDRFGAFVSFTDKPEPERMVQKSYDFIHQTELIAVMAGRRRDSDTHCVHMSVGGGNPAPAVIEPFLYLY